MQSFWDKHLKNSKKGINEIDVKGFETWSYNIRVMNFVFEHTRSALNNKLDALDPTNKVNQFVESCIDIIKSVKTTSKEMKEMIAEKLQSTKHPADDIKRYPIKDPIIKNLLRKLTERGEKAERWLFEQFYQLKGDEITKDLVILTSPKFYHKYQQPKDQKAKAKTET